MARVMGPVDDFYDSTHASFDGERPPRRNGHNRSYKAWKEDVAVWGELTELDEKRRAIAVIGQLDWQPKNLAKKINLGELCRPDGVKIFMETLDKSFVLSKDDRFDAVLMELPD